MVQVKRRLKTLIQVGFALAVLVSFATYCRRIRANDEVALNGARTYVLLKTGVEVMDTRVPVHLATTFKWFPHHDIYAEIEGSILGYPVVNAISYLPEEAFEHKELGTCLVRYREIDEQWGWGATDLIVNGKKIGWFVDVFKNVPAYAHAWIKDPTKDWYLMLDDDTYMLPSTFAAAIEGKDPDDVVYLGRNQDDQPTFAYGGSGIIYSRGAMKAMFGTTKESTQQTLLDSMHLAYGWCCGDAVICYLLSEKWDKHHFRDHLEFYDDSGLFQGYPVYEFITAFKHWCEPIGSFHHGKGGDYDMISRWYESLRLERGKNYRPTYYDYYEKFIMPHVADEIEDWESYHYSQFDFHEAVEGLGSKDACKQRCIDDEECFQWSYREGAECHIIRHGICPGKAVNKYKPGYDGKKSTAGYLVDRILAHRRNPALTCDPIQQGTELPEKQTEGWLLRVLAEGPIKPRMNSLLDL